MKIEKEEEMYTKRYREKNTEEQQKCRVNREIKREMMRLKGRRKKE